MKSIPTMCAFALVAALGFGTTANVALGAPRPAQSADHSSSAGEAVGDAWITTKVKSELATTRGVKSMHVTVRTTDGVVTLTGVLATKTDVRKAIAAARSVKGVKDVDASGLKSKD